MARNTRTFTDLDFNFLSHPKTSDVTVKTDEEAVKQSIRNLILTNNYERPFRSDIGSQISSMLFEPNTMLTNRMIETSIRNVVNNFEPRASLIDVKAYDKPDSNSVFVRIEFTIVNTETPVSINLILERTR